MTIAERQAAFAARLTFDDLPAEVVSSVEDRFLDTLGIALAASTLDTSRAVASLADSWGGTAEASAIGIPQRVPAASAALVNGTLSHSLDYDDTHLPSILHPSASIVPATLAAAQAVHASGRDAIAAAAAAYEICVRLGMAPYDEELRNNVFFERGLHATSICGTIAAAVAASKLFRLKDDALCSAIAIAASMGAGLLEANRSGGTVKRVHCGWAAHAGVVAAQLASAGLTGPRTVFEGRFGFYRALCGEAVNLEVAATGFGQTWETPGIFFKPYPANHFTHAAADAALALREEGLDPDAIETIELGVATPTLRTIAEPTELKARPPNGYAAQFSGPFVVASALLGGGGLGLSLDDFEDGQVRDVRRLALASRVRCIADAECDHRYPYAFPAVLRVTTRAGERFEHRVLENRGGPGWPLSRDELALKFELNAMRALAPERVRLLHGSCLRLHELDTLNDITTSWEDE